MGQSAPGAVGNERQAPEPRAQSVYVPDARDSTLGYNVLVDAVQRCAYCLTHPVEHQWRPFCSERCKLLDLARWVNGDYRVPGETTRIGDQGSEKEGDLPCRDR
jgi:endogenous inhibitor of DNA gyrase (YacG/DUF329 family)